MTHGTHNISAGLALATLYLVAACQQTPSLDNKTYPDAVVKLSQVDPVYRPYFASQNGANYSREEQMAAFNRAKQTANGPMPNYVQAPAKSKSKAKTTAKGKGKATSKGKTSTKGKTTTTKGKTTSKAKTPPKKPTAKAPAKKPAAKKPATKGKSSAKKK